MSAFARGMQLGQQAWDSAEESRRNKEKDARAAEEFQWRKDEVARLGQARAREDAAFSSLENVQRGLSTDTQGQITQTYGMTPQQISAAGDGLQTKLTSYDQPDSYDLQSAPATGVQPRFTADQVKTQPASRLDIERAMGGVALAKRDVAGYRASLAEQQKFQAEDETRGFLRDTKTLWENRTKSPEAMEAWVNHVRPYADMVSKFKGYEADALVDPKTGVIKVVPYGSDKAQEIPFEQVAPYLLQTHRLSSQFGDPMAAVEALNKLSAEERARVMADTNFRFGLADKQSSSIDRGRGRDLQERELQSNQDFRNRSLGLQRERNNIDRNPLQQKIETLERNLGRKLTEAEITALGGLKTGDSFKELPDDGTRVRDGKGNVYTYVGGEPVLNGGVPSSQVGAQLEKLGFPPQAEAMVKPLPGGRHVMVPGDSESVYDLADPNDRKMALEAVNRVTQSGAAATELRARGGWAPRGTQGTQPVTRYSGYTEAKQNAAQLNNRPLLGLQR